MLQNGSASCRQLPVKGKLYRVANDGQRSTQPISAGTAVKHSCPRISATIVGQPVSCLIDSESPVSILPQPLLNGTEVGHYDNASFLSTADGKRLKVLGEVTGDVVLAFKQGKRTSSHPIIVADVVTGPILGTDFLTKRNAEISFQYGETRSCPAIPVLQWPTTCTYL